MWIIRLILQQFLQIKLIMQLGLTLFLLHQCCCSPPPPLTADFSSFIHLFILFSLYCYWIYLSPSSLRIHQQEAEKEQQSRELLEKRIQAVTSLKSNIAATQVSGAILPIWQCIMVVVLAAMTDKGCGTMYN